MVYYAHMRKMLILALALWAGTSNLAYAAAQEECASKMERHACPSSMPCQCAIQAPSSEQVVPTPVHTSLEKLQLAVLSVTSAVVMPADFRFAKEPFESPPKEVPLYQLFSVYRI